MWTLEKPIPSGEQACIPLIHCRSAATFHHLHLFQLALPQGLQVYPEWDENQS